MANTPQQAAQAIQKADNGKYDYGNMKSQNKNIQAIHNAKNEELKSERIKEIEKQQKETVECTIIVSGLNYGQNGNLLQDAANDADKILLLFDAVPSYSYSRTVQKTEFAVESQQTYSDHAVIKDDVFTLTAYINTSPTYIRKGNKIDQDVDPNNPAASMRPAKALDLLKRLVDSRQLITLATEEGTYKDFIITKLTAKRDVSEGAALVVEIEFSEFRTFELYKTVDATITTDPKKSPTKNKGAVSSSSNKAADSDKFKNENTAWKGSVFDGHSYNPETGELTNSSGEVLEDFKKNGGIVTPKGYKPNVSLNRK